MLKVGIVGLPNAGKSTLFNALTSAHVPAAAHPFTTVDPNVGEALVPDARLEKLTATLRPERVVPAHVRFVDIAGLVRGAHRGEGLGNRFLGHIREMDAVLLVLRAFGSPTAPHPEGSVEPVRDYETLVAEMALADLEASERAAARLAKQAAATRDDAGRERARILERARDVLARGEPLWTAMSHEELDRIRDQFLLLGKPFLIVLNIGEEDAALPDDVVHQYRESFPPGAEVVAVCAQLEEEVEDLEDHDARDLLAGYGIEERGTARIAEAARRLLRLIAFYSIESSECRAWLVPEGTSAVGAAAEIHTDMAEGFMKADVVPAETLVEAGSVAAARERGLVRAEGRDYVVRDGDVLTFRFRTRG